MEDKSFFLENGQRAVVLLHAYTSSANDMYSLGNELGRQGYTVYAPTFSGHAEDNLDDLLQSNAKNWVQDGKDAVAFIRDKGYTDIAIFGLSLGGLVSMKTIIDDPDLLAAGTFCSPAIDHKRGSRVKENFMKLYKKSKQREGLSEEEIEKIIPQVEKKLGNALGTLDSLVNSMDPHYSEITQPIFIAQGGKDTMISPTIAADFRDALTQSERVAFNYYEDAPHYITVGRHGKELQKDFIPFIDSLDWRVK